MDDDDLLPKPIDTFVGTFEETNLSNSKFACALYQKDLIKDKAN